MRRTSFFGTIQVQKSNEIFVARLFGSRRFVCISRCVWHGYWPSFYIPYAKVGARDSMSHWLDYGIVLDLFAVRLKGV